MSQFEFIAAGAGIAVFVLLYLLAADPPGDWRWPSSGMDL